MTHDSALMTVGEVARYLQLHRHGVHKITHSGKLRAQRTIGGQFVFRFITCACCK